MRVGEPPPLHLFTQPLFCMPTRVALDAMGGDDAPAVVVDGAVRAARHHPDTLHLLLVGRQDEVAPLLDQYGAESLPITVVDAPEVIGMDEAPAVALKGKPHSSIHLGIGMVKAGKADAFCSAGNTGAVMAAAAVALGRLKGVLRPAMPSHYPSVKGGIFILDVGANVDSRPEQLVQFAQMGRIFAERVMGLDEATVGLLNVGEEKSKGNEATKAAYAKLAELAGQDARFRFVGNVEGRDVMHHAADVVVCDGFVGNVVLKLGESLTTVLPALFKQAAADLQLGAEEAGLVKRVLGHMMAPFDYERYGGVPLLGVDGAVVIGHGGSSAKAIEQMVLAAARVHDQDVKGHIAAALGG